MDATRSPGWYPAPDGNGQQWWNGAGWSESRQGAAGTTAPIVRAGQMNPTAAVTPTPPSVASAPPPGGTPLPGSTPRVVYSASNPAPQYPGQAHTTLRAQFPAAMQVDTRANPAAMYALVAGIASVVFNVLLIPSILAIVFAASAFKRAKELAAAGKPNTMRQLAVVGLCLGIFGAIIGVVPVIAFIVTFVSSILSATTA